MITVTNEEVRLLRPCIDPIKFYSDDNSYTLENILMNDKIEDPDKIWVVTKLIGDDDDTTKINRRLAIYAANYAIASCDKAKIEIDLRTRNAPKVARAYFKGKVTKAELKRARSAANSARSAAHSAAAYSAALSAAYAAADSAADSADYAAHSAAHSATNADYSAGSVAYSAAYSAFIAELLRLIQGVSK